MEAPQIFAIILSELVNDRLQLESELERVINLDDSIPDKVEKIKFALKQVALNDLMVGKWKSYIPTNNDDDKEE